MPESQAASTNTFLEIIRQITVERSRQDAKFVEQNHPPQDWMMILQEEIGEFARAHMEVYYSNPNAVSAEGRAAFEAELRAKRLHIREELVQVAAVAVAMIECGDRNQWWPR